MVLAFDNAGDFAKAVYGEPQHAGPNGAIAMTPPSAKMAGGNKSRKDRKNNKSRNNNKRHNNKNQNGGNNKSRKNQNGGNNKSRNNNKNQNGGK